MVRRAKTVDRLQLADVGEAHSDYKMAKRHGAQQKLRRGVPAYGAGADYHYRTEADWLWMQELAWDIYRNDMIAGSVIDRVVDNQLQGGFTYNPQTGDRQLDTDQRQWWEEISENSNSWDPSGEQNFFDQEEFVLRSALVGGDIFVLPTADGTMALVESQFCRAPSRSVKENIVHGVEMDATTRRRINYWFTKEQVSAYRQIVNKSDLAPTPAFYSDPLTRREERNVFHVRFSKRAHQTRGITALTPIFDVAGYHDDIQFLTMVQKRSASFFAFFRQRAVNFDTRYLAAQNKLGADVTGQKRFDDEYEANAKQYQAVSPGSVFDGLPGEQISVNSTNIPSPEHFPHCKMLLTILGINLGAPLVMVLMDASETNFSGWRGAIDMARLGFRTNQQRLAMRFHCPVMRWKILKRAEDDRSIAKLVRQSLKPGATVNIFKHKWNPPGWPYIEPTKDATADLIRDANMQTSPRRRHHERGVEWPEIVEETIADRSLAITTALTEADKINKQFKLEGPAAVVWRDLAPLPTPDGVSVRLMGVADSQPEDTQPQPQKKP